MSVPQLLADARSYTTTLTSQAGAAMASAIELASAVGYTVPGYNALALPAVPTALPILALPALTNFPLDVGQLPVQGTLFPVTPVVVGVAPNRPGNAPVLVSPTKPTMLREFLESAPAINLVGLFPTAPSLLMPDAPTLGLHTEPTAPAVNLPAFSGVKPTDAPAAPGDLSSSFDAAYRTAAPSTIAMVNGYVDAQLLKINPRYTEQMGRIEDQLATYLAGGTALKPAVENAIYERSRSKNSAETRRARDAAYVDAASRGFTLPPGSLMSALQQGRQEGANNNAQAAREIVVMQGEMEQKNLQFAVTTSVGLRTAMLGATLSYMQNLTAINGQALEYAKSMLGALIETYNVAVKVFSLKLEAYKTDASVYEILIRASLASVEIYKAEIAALQALTEVDRSRVEIYKARIEVMTAMTTMYRTEVEAAVSKASLEKLKIELFQAQVQSYSAEVSAKNSEWEGYTAAVGGNNAVLMGYTAEVQAYSASVQGFKADIEAQVEVVQATTAVNEGITRQHLASVSGFTAVVQAKGEVARTQLENQRLQLVAFQAEAAALVANAQVSIESFKATSTVAIENAKLQLSAQVQGAENKRAYGDSLARLGTANAQIYSGLAGAALSGMNTLSSESLTNA